MKFKTWKEANERAMQLKPEIEALDAEIASTEKEARSEELDVEKREKLITDLQSKVTKRNGLQKDYNEAVEARDKLKEQEERQIGLINSLSTQRVTERNDSKNNDNVYETRSYEVAWGHYVLTNDERELRSLVNTEDAANAGYLIPARLANSIKENVFTSGKLLGMCNIITGKGELHQPYLNSETEPEVHKEKSGSRKKEKSIEFAIRKIRTEFIAEWISVSRKFENNDGGLFFDWLMRKLPKAILKKQENLLLKGSADGSEGFVGILNETDARFVAKITSDLTFNTVNIAVAALDDGVEDGAVAVMNRNTFFNNVMGLKGDDGHPVYKIMTDNTGKPIFMYGGYRVFFNSNISAYNDATDGEAVMLVGDFKGYTIQYPNGTNPSILRDPYSKKDYNIIEYLCELESGGNILDLGHFVKVMKKAAV